MNFQNQESEKVDVNGHTERNSVYAVKSRDSISTQNKDLDDSVSLPKNEPPLKKKKTLKTTITEGKLELLTRCAESMAPGSSAKQLTLLR